MGAICLDNVIMIKMKTYDYMYIYPGRVVIYKLCHVQPTRALATKNSICVYIEKEMNKK